MISHRVSGVEMAQAAAERAQTDLIRDLARSRAEAQRTEIEFMREMLVERGQEPVPVEPTMDHGDH